MSRNFITFLILTSIGGLCLAQNPDGKMSLSLRDRSNRIDFIINKNDSIFYDKNNEFKLKVYGSLQNGKHFFLYTQRQIDHSFKHNNGKASFQRDSTKLEVHFNWAGHLKIELEEVKSHKKMIIDFKNVNDSNFSIDFKFKSGEYTVDIKDLLEVGKLIRKKGFNYYFIRQKYFEKEN